MVFKKGQVSLNKGKKASEELRRKLSEAHKGKKQSEETKRKRSESMKGKNRYKRTEETLKKLSEAHKGQTPYMAGKKHTPESLLKMSLAHKGQVAWNKGKTTPEDVRKKLSIAHFGIKYPNRHTSPAKIRRGYNLSEETKAKIRDALKKRFPLGMVSPMKGKHHSAETIRKQSESLKKTYHTHPELRIRMSEISKKQWNSLELRKKQSEIIKRIMANPEVRKKLSEISKGKHHSLNTEFKKGHKETIETSRKRSEAMKGEKCYLWKGGITPLNQKIRTSRDFKAWREAVFKRDNWTCCICKNRGGKLNAHHIKEFSKYPELRFVVENGLTLCSDCHKKTENYGKKGRFK